MANQQVAIAISQPLKILALDIEKYLKVDVGDDVELGTIIAKKSGKLGLGGTQLQSPVKGIVRSIDLDKGTILIEITDEKLKIEAANQNPKMLQKPHADILKLESDQNKKYNRGSKTDKNSVTAIFACGNNSGTGWFIEHGFDNNSLIPEMKDRIILLKEMPTIAQIFKCSAIGANAIVVACSQIDAGLLDKIKSELSGKSHLAFLVLPNDYNLAMLHNISVEIIGEDKKLIINK